MRRAGDRARKRARGDTRSGGSHVRAAIARGAAVICALIGLSVVALPAGVGQAARMPRSGVVAWGNNEFGQLGVEPEPAPGEELRGSHNGPESCSTEGALGYPRQVACSGTPVAVPGLSEVTAVEGEGGGAGSFSVALLANGTVIEWGRPNEVAGSGPAPVGGLQQVRAISRGLERGVALLRSGAVMEWSPGAAPRPVPGLEHVRAIAPHGATTAVLDNGTVVQWAGGTPQRVAGIGGARSVASAGCCSLAVLQNGTVMGWGFNLSGCLGSSDIERVQQPIQIADLTNVSAVALGGIGPTTACFALLRDGTVVELGYGGTRPVAGLDQVKALSVAAHGALSLALRRDGTVLAFRGVPYTGAQGAFGDGTSETLPAVVSNLTHATAIAAAGTLAFIGDVAEDPFGLAAWAHGGFAHSHRY